jgi:hypothetical protein
MREVARASTPTLPRGTYLLRVDPAAVTTAPADFRAQVAQAMQRAGQSVRVSR